MMPLRHTINNALIRLTGAAARVSQQRVLMKYEDVATRHPERQNPVIVIPGVLGSRLVHRQSGTTLWGGSNKAEFADVSVAEELRGVCFPIESSTPLDRVETQAEPAGAVLELQAKVLGLPLAVKAYGPILDMFGITGFLQARSASDVDRSVPRERPGSPMCFEFDYDWRRSIPDNAARLGTFIELVRDIAKDVGHTGRDGTARVDIVAHSLGGLLLRYYLRYGRQLLSETQGPPDLTWAGANDVDRVLLVGVPNGGAVEVVEKLIEGLSESAASPAYSSAVLGTMPALYQLMPRTRYGSIEHGNRDETIDLFDVETWERNRWGLLDERNDEELKVLLPSAASRSDREREAADHLASCLAEAQLVHRALDRQVDPPPGLHKHLFVGDGVMTPERLRIADDRTTEVISRQDGDGTVLRSSALLDERISGRNESVLQSPIRWSGVTFIPADHMMLTSHPTFINNALYQILEDPTPHHPPTGERRKLGRRGLSHRAVKTSPQRAG